MISRAIVRGLALAGALAGASAWGDTVRVKTGRGTFLVEVDDPAIAVRAEGDELVVSRGPGDEVRLRLDPEGPARPSREPALTILRGGKAVVTARRLPTGPAIPPPPAVAAVPGATVLGGRPGWTAWSLAMTPDGRTLVVGHQSSLRIWDLPARKERLAIPVPRTVRRVAVTPDGATIASAEYDFAAGKAMGNVVVRDGKTGEVRRVMSPVEAVHGVAIDPEGKVIVSSSWAERDIRVWDASRVEQVGTLKGHSGVVSTLAFSPDGKALASAGDQTVRLWDADTGEVRKVFRGHQGTVETLSFSADGKFLASGGFDNTARAWDVATGKELALLETDQPVLSVAMSPDGKSVATADARWGNGFYNASPAEVRVWDVATGKASAWLPDQPNQVFAMVFTPDGKSLITASLSGAVTLWDLAAFRADPSLPIGSPPERIRDR